MWNLFPAISSLPKEREMDQRPLEESGLLRITAALQWGAIGDYSNSNKSSPIEWHFGSLAINCRAINDATRGTFDRQIDASCHNYFPLSIHSDTLLLL
jgi:hypothetical protein